MASKSVLVTGASSGIGQACAQRFHDAGWRVIATARSTDGRHPDYDWVALDLNDADSINHACSAVKALVGTPDVVINNAGYGLIAPVETVETGAAERQFQANYFGTLAVTRAFLPDMRERNSGVIAAVSSIGGRMAFPFFGHYNASKHALEAAYESLHHELAHSNIRVRIIEPGFTQTQFATHGMDQSYHDEPYYVQGLTTLARRLQTGDTGTDPAVLGELIFRACTDKGGLRHAAGSLAKPLLWARRLLPEAWFLGLITRATNPKR